MVDESKEDEVSAACEELRKLIRSKISSGMTPDLATDEVMKLFYQVEDDWDRIDITSYADLPGSRYLNQRWLVCRIPRDSEQVVRVADRSVK